MKCFKSQSEQDIFLINSQEYYPPSSWNLSDPIDIAIYASQYRLAEARIAVEAELCNATSGDILPFVGTTTVVRDMDKLYRAIEGDDEPINYWGFSYGTALGLYLVNMYVWSYLRYGALPSYTASAACELSILHRFPDHVGKVVIDGVLVSLIVPDR